MTRQAVTKHLHVLSGAGLAAASRQGREQRWSLDQRQLAQARLFLDRISQQWDDALARLKAAVEGEEPQYSRDSPRAARRPPACYRESYGRC